MALADIRAAFNEAPDLRRVCGPCRLHLFDRPLANGDVVSVEADEHGDPWAWRENGAGRVHRRAV